MSIFFDSSLVKALSRFTGKGFRKFAITISIDRTNSIQRYFSVLSNGKRNVVLKYLFNKYLWDNLSKKEFELFLTFPELTTNSILFSTLRVRQLGLSKKVLRKRLLQYKSIFDSDLILTYSSYKGLSNSVSISFVEGMNILPRTKKFSGYTKHHKDHGSLNPGTDIIDSTILDEDNFDQEIFVFDFLLGNVDTFPLLAKLFSSDDI